MRRHTKKKERDMGAKESKTCNMPTIASELNIVTLTKLGAIATSLKWTSNREEKR